MPAPERATLAAVLDVDGPAAPPRRNGELVFNEPWESRAFGLALTLHAGCVFDWEEFRRELIAVINEWERTHDPGEEWSYYRCWLVALERVLDAKGLVHRADVAARAEAFADRPSGHDHRHDDDHAHDGDDHADHGHSGQAHHDAH